MANTHHTGIPKLQWSFAYPPCVPSVRIVADINPFCSGDSVTFTPTFDCVDTAVIEEYAIEYGALYNWYAATDARGITSEGEFVVPSYANWLTLANALGGIGVAGGKLKETGFTYFASPNTGATNEVGFNGRGSGSRATTFNGQGLNCFFLTTENYTSLQTYIEAIGNTNDDLSVGVSNKSIGGAIRTFRIATTAEQLLSDGTPCAPYVGNDGKVYATVKIGTQVWLADNLAETMFRNGDYIHGYESGTYQPISNEDWDALETAGMCFYDDLESNAYTYTNTSQITAYAWLLDGAIVSTSPEPYVSNTLYNNARIGLLFITSSGQNYFSNMIVMQEKTEGCPEIINYGLLYNWHSATDARGITSSDNFIVPEIEDWVDLLLYFGGSDYRPDFPAADLFENTLQLLSLTTWGEYAGTNTTGFNLKGGGFRDNSGFAEKDFSGLYIAKNSLADNATSPFGVGLSAPPEAYLAIYTSIEGMAYSKTYANSLKCFRWATESELLLQDGLISEKYIGNNGNEYDLTKIDNRIWLADNLAETKFRDGSYIHGYEGGSYQAISNAAWAALETDGVCAYNDDINLI